MISNVTTLSFVLASSFITELLGKVKYRGFSSIVLYGSQLWALQYFWKLETKLHAIKALKRKEEKVRDINLIKKLAELSAAITWVLIFRHSHGCISILFIFMQIQ